MRIIITGVSGLLGINIAITAAKDHTILGVLNKHPLSTPLFQSTHIDLFNSNETKKLLDNWKPDWIIHCAALADVNLCEENPKLAYEINVNLTQQLADLANQNDIKFLYISTDCVFDGLKKEGYLESDNPNPINIYGQTKLAGEQAVLNLNPNSLIARVNFFGWSTTGTRSLAEWVINNLRTHTPMKGFIDVKFSPLLANTLASILLDMMKLNLHGIYHVDGSEQISKYDFALYLARQFQLDEKLITPSFIKELNLRAARPLNMFLDNKKLMQSLNSSIPNIFEDIQSFHKLELEGYSNTIRSFNKPINALVN